MGSLVGGLIGDEGAVRDGTRGSALEAAGWLALLPALLFTAVVYRPILDNYFSGDDFLNLYRIVNMPMGEYLVTPHGGHALLVRNLLFYLTAVAAGPSPAAFFWSVLVTHLVNVALLFVVIRILTASSLLAGLGALLWGSCPVHEGTLGWYSVYGQVVATTAMLVILVLLARAGAEGRSPTRAALATCYILALLAVMSFGVGIGIAMALPFVAACLAPAVRDPRRWGPPLRSLLVVVPAIYVGFFWLHGLFFDEGLETPLILVRYATQLWRAWVPSVLHLVAYGTLREVSSFAFNPGWFTVEIAYVTVGILVAWGSWVAWRGPVEVRRTLAACALLILGCYGFIAAGRAVFIQGFLVIIQARYYYAALAPMTVFLCVLLAQVQVRALHHLATRTALFATAIALVVLFYADCAPRIENFTRVREQTETLRAEVRSVAEAATPPGRPVFIPNRHFPGYFASPATDFPGSAAVFAIFNESPIVARHRVFFTDQRPEVVAAAKKGRRSAGLLISPRPRAGPIPPPGSAASRSGAEKVTPWLRPREGAVMKENH